MVRKRVNAQRAEYGSLHGRIDWAAHVNCMDNVGFKRQCCISA